MFGSLRFSARLLGAALLFGTLVTACQPESIAPVESAAPQATPGLIRVNDEQPPKTDWPTPHAVKPGLIRVNDEQPPKTDWPTH